MALIAVISCLLSLTITVIAGLVKDAGFANQAQGALWVRLSCRRAKSPTNLSVGLSFSSPVFSPELGEERIENPLGSWK